MGVCGFGDGSKPRGMPFLLRLSIACPSNRCRGIAYFQLKDRREGEFLVEPSIQEEEGGRMSFLGSSSV